MSELGGPTDTLARAIELLETGAWQPAHEIVQEDKSDLAAWLHGIVHTLEGDLDNARYWYRRAERAFPGPDAVREEIAAARRTLALIRNSAAGPAAGGAADRGPADTERPPEPSSP